MAVGSSGSGNVSKYTRRKRSAPARLGSARGVTLCLPRSSRYARQNLRSPGIPAALEFSRSFSSLSLSLPVPLFSVLALFTSRATRPLFTPLVSQPLWMHACNYRGKKLKLHGRFEHALAATLVHHRGLSVCFLGQGDLWESAKQLFTGGFMA